jgi:hypothetical protein
MAAAKISVFIISRLRRCLWLLFGLRLLLLRLLLLLHSSLLLLLLLLVLLLMLFLLHLLCLLQTA